MGNIGGEKKTRRILFSGVLAVGSGPGPDQHDENRAEATGSEPAEKIPQVGSLQAKYVELPDEDVEHGGRETSIQTAVQINLYLLVHEVGSSLLSGRTIKAVFLHEPLEPTSGADLRSRPQEPTSARRAQV